MAAFYSFAALIGLLTLGYIGYQVFGWLHFIFHSSKLYRYAHNPNPNLKLDRQLSKPWALITGASDGIGKALARDLCSRGFNVVIHGRPGSKLKKVKSDLEKDFNADVRLMAIDATDPTIWANFEQNVLRILDGINLTVVINNLGGGGGIFPVMVTVADRPFQDEETLISVNLRFMAHLNRIVIPILDKNSPGLLMNLSSAGESVPMPYYVTYSALKAFVKQYSHSLRVELKLEKKDIECVSITSAAVVTDGAGRTSDDLNLLTPTPSKFAKAVLDKVGYDSPSYAPYLPHYLSTSMLSLLPGTWVDSIMASNMKKEVIRFNPSLKKDF